MKLENQVCSYEQGLRLKELGVNHGSIFYWFKNENLEGEFIDLGILYNPSEESISAYTVAELGVMLPMDGDGIGEYYTLQDTGFLFNNDTYGGDNKGFSIVPAYPESNDVDTWPNVCNAVFKTEAEARAAMLIYLLENNHTTPEEVNTRLNNQ